MADPNSASSSDEVWRQLTDNKELLSLVLEIHKISEEACARKLAQESEVIRKWALELEKEGWIEIYDKETSNQLYSLAEGSWERVRLLKEDLVRAQVSKKDVKAAIAKKKLKKKHKKPPKIIRKARGFVKKNKIDLIIVLAIYSCITFADKFLQDPNREINSFLIASVSFALILILYYKFEENIIIRVYRFLRYQLKRNSHYYIVIFIMLTFIFYGGRLLATVEFRTINLVIAVGSLASLPIIYLTREKSLGEKIRFVAGIILLFYAFTLLFGYLSLSELILVGAARNRVMDIFAGFAILIILQQMEYYFGLGGGSLKTILKKKSEIED
ncbi:hypothetical protein ACFLRC_04995 [Candidatus Altiarchaeota archaeon]